MTVSELDCMSNRELMEWIAFYELEPFGTYRDNLHAGMIASILFNANRSKRSAPMTPDDFIIRDKHQQKEKETAEFFAGLKALAKPKAKT